ncbi:Uncharacterised protein [Mycobacterium tuberculosis]|nr:Uncharacterised protein [Mycobacterium tuberculosis]
MPRPVPSTSRISDKDAAPAAPAKIAPHETPLRLPSAASTPGGGVLTPYELMVAPCLLVVELALFGLRRGASVGGRR